MMKYYERFNSRRWWWYCFYPALIRSCKDGERFSDLRVGEDQTTNAQIIGTSCPYCISCLEDSVKAQGIEEFAEMEVAEIAALAI